jgi:hypothetical protein
MVTHMKTTIDIADALFEQARRVAAREGTTIKALVEQGLENVLSERRAAPAFRLRDASYGGEGLQPAAAAASWDRLRELSCEGRGG